MSNFTSFSASSINASYDAYLNFYEVSTVPPQETVEEETPQTIEPISFEDYLNQKYQTVSAMLTVGSTFSHVLAEKYDSTEQVESPITIGDLAALTEESGYQWDGDTQSLVPQQEYDSESITVGALSRLSEEDGFQWDGDTQFLVPQQQWDAESFAAVYWEELCQEFDALDELYSCLHTVTPVAVNVDAIVEEVAADLRRSTSDNLAGCMTVVKKRAAISSNNMEEVYAALLV